MVEMSCTQSILKPQAARAVKKIACKPIPFANCDPSRLSAFERLYERLAELISNTILLGLKKISLLSGYLTAPEYGLSKV